MRDYLKSVYPEYHPQRDPDAALKFSLATLAKNGRFRKLRHLVQDGDPISEVSDDDAGWTLARRDERAHAGGYSAWPSNAKFRAYVDPAVYQLAHPMAYFDTEAFARIARPLLVEARLHHPRLRDEIDAIVTMLVKDF
jgi:hypothetical protein